MPGASDQVSDDEVPIPCLHATSPFWLSARAAVTSPADSDDEVPIPRFSHRPTLVSCYGDAEGPLLHLGVSRLYSSTSHPIVRSQTCPAGWRPRPMPSWPSLGRVDTDTTLSGPHLEIWGGSGKWDGKASDGM
jgi:phosphate-selective porin